MRHTEIELKIKDPHTVRKIELTFADSSRENWWTRMFSLFSTKESALKPRSRKFASLLVPTCIRAQRPLVRERSYLVKSMEDWRISKLYAVLLAFSLCRY